MMQNALTKGIRTTRVAKRTLDFWGKREDINRSAVSGFILSRQSASPLGDTQGGAFRQVHTSTWLQNPKENEAVAEQQQRTPGPGTKGQPAPSRVEKTVNQITLMGRVGGDPQMRGTTEHPVVVFSLATHANYNYQSGEMLQKTDWHRVCVFKPYLRDSVYKYMSKGQRVYVTGRVSYGEITDDAGKTTIATSIIADDVIFITDSAKNKAPATEAY